jgi:hypothetical protein
MAVNVEQLGALERRVSMSVPVQDVDRQVDDRLKKLARNVKMAGFRPGKVPMKMVVQQYGPQVRSEVIGDAVQKAFPPSRLCVIHSPAFALLSVSSSLTSRRRRLRRRINSPWSGSHQVPRIVT